MASRVVVFAALLLMSLLATTSMGTPWENCYEPWGYPMFDHPLPLCRAVARSRCLGVPVAASAKAACCRQLADVDGWCKCPALFKMVGIIFEERGLGKGQTEVFPGCRAKDMQRAGASIPTLCKQDIPVVGTGGFCCWVDYPIG